jgi:hypothetical protein
VGVLARIRHKTCNFNDLPRSCDKCARLVEHSTRRVKHSTRPEKNWPRRNKKRSRCVIFVPKRGLP